MRGLVHYVQEVTGGQPVTCHDALRQDTYMGTTVSKEVTCPTCRQAMQVSDRGP